MSFAEKLTKIAENERKVYEAGSQKGAEQVWDNFLQNGKRTNFNQALCGFDDTTFYPTHDIVPTCAMGMFRYAKITNLEKRLEDCGVKLDLSKAILSATGSITSKPLTTLMNNSTITHFPMVKPFADHTNYDGTAIVNSLDAIFSGASELKSVRGFELVPWVASEHIIDDVVTITLETVDFSQLKYRIILSEPLNEDFTLCTFCAVGFGDGNWWEHRCYITIPAGTTSYDWQHYQNSDGYTPVEGGIWLSDSDEYTSVYTRVDSYTLIVGDAPLEAPKLSYPMSMEFSSSSFTNCAKLEEIHEFKSTGVTADYTEPREQGYVKYYYLGLIHHYINISASPNVTKDTLLRISDALVDYRRADIVGSALANKLSIYTGTCIFGATNLAKLTDEEKKAITKKGWTLS